jgi:methylisocitrate lyase
MTLMTASESQVDKAMYDLGAWQTSSSDSVFPSSKNLSAQQKSPDMESFESGEATPFPDAVFTLDNSPSGSTTPYEAITPPNGLETVFDIKIDEDSIPSLPSLEDAKPSLEVEPTVQPTVQPEGLVDIPAEEIEIQVPQPLLEEVPEIQVTDVVQVEEISSTSQVQIRAPATLDPFAPASTRLRHMIKNLDHILVCPGVYDGLSARIAIATGFEGMYMTGAGTNASRLGMADLGIAHLHDMRTNAEMISNLKPDGPPVIADMDTGYGGPMVIDRSLQQYHLAGVAGFHIEDQVMQKRCGHLAGKEVVDIDTYISRIKACVQASKRLRSDIVIIARTDALQSRGYDDCIARLRRARDEGADMGILEGFSSKAQARQAVKDLAPWPLCLNSVENGVSPLISVDEAQDMGFRVVIFSFASLAPAYTAIKNTFEWLKEYGVTGSSVSPKTIFNVCGLQDLMVIDEQAGGDAFKKGV